MKQDKNQAGTDQLNQKIRMNLKFSSRIQEILCVEGCKAKFLCISKNCKEPAFMCDQQKCICQKVHENCSNKKLKGVIKKIEQKITKFDPIIQQNQRLINQRIAQHKTLIQKLQLFIKQIREIAQNQNLNCLSECERTIYKAILSKKTDQVKGFQIFNIEKQLEKDFTIEIQKQVNILNQTWKKYKVKTPDFQVQIMKDLKKFFQKREQQNLNSSILKSIDEIYFLKHVLKGVNKYELLYRASQNNFKIQKFRQTCMNIPHTLILIQTQNNFKFGFYTSIQWKQSNSIVQVGKEDVIFFSFSNNLNAGLKADFKYNLQNNENFGPCFIHKKNKKLSIKLHDNCDKIPLDNEAFTDKYKENYYILFQSKMKIKQWEVWKINFVEQKLHN